MVGTQSVFRGGIEETNGCRKVWWWVIRCEQTARGTENKGLTIKKRRNDFSAEMKINKLQECM